VLVALHYFCISLSGTVIFYYENRIQKSGREQDNHILFYINVRRFSKHRNETGIFIRTFFYQLVKPDTQNLRAATSFCFDYGTGHRNFG
jgi:hypothetical protein